MVDVQQVLVAQSLKVLTPCFYLVSYYPLRVNAINQINTASSLTLSPHNFKYHTDL